MIDPETGDLMVRSGALVVGDTTAQTAEAVLQAMRGEFKEFPATRSRNPQDARRNL